MGSIVVTEFVTLDGVMEDPGGAEGFDRGQWAFKFDRGPEGDKFKVDELVAADAQLLGRVTYEGFAKAWPNMRGDEFGEKMNSMPKYVVSSTLTEATWENSTIISGELEPEIKALKDRYSGDILIAGSAQLVQGLTARGLVDRYHLMVFPTILGAGKRLFADAAQAQALRLTSSRQSGDVAILTFESATS